MSEFDPDALRPMIIARKGDVRAIADDLTADSEDLRDFIMNTPLLRRALDEVIARGVDQSLGVLFKGLDDDEHFSNQIAAAKEFLKSRAGQRRGFHHAGDLELKMPSQGRRPHPHLAPAGAQRAPRAADDRRRGGGGVSLASIPFGPQPNQRIIALLREALRDAKAGRIQAVGLAVACASDAPDADLGRTTETPWPTPTAGRTRCAPVYIQRDSTSIARAVPIKAEGRPIRRVIDEDE